MKRISCRARCAFTILFFATHSAFAISEWFESYNNTRSLGMGGASVAVSSDETALFRNPANLGSIRDVYGTIFDPELEGSTNFVRQVTSNSTSKAFQIEEIKNVLDSNRETYYRAKLQVSPSFVRRNFGFGLIYKNEVSAQTDASGTLMDTKYQSDFAAVVGVNARLLDGRIKVGASVKAINRIEVDNPILSTAGPFELETIGSEGSAFSYTAGILLQAPWKMIPTLGVVMRDIGDTKFTAQDGFRMRAQSRPQTEKQSVDVALALFPIHANQMRSVWTLEYSDVTNSRNDTDQKKRAHFGIELNTNDIFFFRMGYNQRYWTAGFELASEIVQWQVSTYGEEVGTADSPKEDRRLNTKVSIRF